MCLCLIGAFAFNGKEAYPKDPTDEKSDFSCDEKGYLEYLSKWGDAKGTSRDVKSEEFKKRLEYFKQSCKKIHRGSGKRRYKLEFTFYADWAPEEFEEITASVVRYKGVQPETEVIPIMNNTNYRYLMPSMDPCDENAELRELISKPQNCSVSWAFAITNSIEYAIKKMYFEHYDQIVEVSLSAQELIDCVGVDPDDPTNPEKYDEYYDEKKGGCAGFSLASGFDYVSLYGIAYSESYPHRNEKGECRRKEIGEEHRYRIAGYEKPVTYNKLGLFDLMKRGPVAVTMGLDPQYFQYYRSDRDGEFYFDSSSNQPSVYGVVVEYSQFAADGKDELAKYPYFAVETRLRGCDSMVFRLPILDTVENANVGGIAGLAIRPIVSEMVSTPEPTPDTPSEEPPTPEPTTEPPTPEPPTEPPTTEPPTTDPPTTLPPVGILLVPATLVSDLLTEAITITDGLCSSYQDTQLIIQGLPNLKSIVIGDDCFGSVRSLELNGLYELESVVIGQRSFTLYPKGPWTHKRTDGECRITNCPKLKSLAMGDFSFGDYNAFELDSLPSLQSIEIGIAGFHSTSSFSLTGLIDQTR